MALTLLLDFARPGFAPPAEHRVVAAVARIVCRVASAAQWADFGPNFEQLVNPDVWRLAMTLAIVASLETLLSLEAVEQIDPADAPRSRIANSRHRASAT